MLTAARSGEVRGARWGEIDTDDHLWTVPTTRTEAKREHRVPLSGRALEVLDAARTLDDGNRLVSPSVRGKRMNDMACRHCSGRWRSPPCTASAPRSGTERPRRRTTRASEVVEAALAHVVQNKVEAAYARSDLFERRRRLMDDWSVYVAGNAGSAA